jgi:hypothetical protein
MTKINTVTLEFLRLGPAHNQLLSPLTEYLGLCGNNGAAAVHVPYEHRNFLTRHIELRYQGGKQDRSDEDVKRRQSVLDETAGEMADILGSVPGLVSGLSKAQAGGECLTHLRLVLSAAELALLPFELSKVPKGCVGGEDSRLSLQTTARVCITRQVRTVSTTEIQWPLKPRILFIAAAPGGTTVPVQQHLQALHKAIKPWLHPFEKGNSKDLEEKVGKILTVLPDATVEEVEKVCSETAFTHVHILAHGMPNKKLPGSPYGLALHSRFNKEEVDIVSGDRFASVLGAQKTCELPAVVTVASCDSGNVGDVVYTGASFAHDLHQAGIPFVIASQFPLSFAGSILMAEVVYEKLLWGGDPRFMLYDLRRKLHALHTVDTHDWASLVAYEALPTDLSMQLKDVRYVQSRKAIDASMKHIDRFIDESDEIEEEEFKELLYKVDNAAKRMPTTEGYETEGTGMLASLDKRKAQVFYKVSGKEDGDNKNKYLGLCLEALTESMSKYKIACDEILMETGSVVRKKRSLQWVLVQYLSLRAVLGKGFYIKLWQAAKLSAEIDFRTGDPVTQIYAHASLAELYLLLLAYNEKWLPQQESDEGPIKISHQMARIKAVEHAKEVAYSNLENPFPVYSTWRQFERYIVWWGRDDFVKFLEESELFPKLDMPGIAGVLDIAKEIVDLFPKKPLDQ